MAKSFEDIYTQYYKKIYLFLYRMTDDGGLSEELTQETFLQAYLSLYRFRGDCDIFTWLASIAKHMYFGYLKKNRLLLDSIDLSAVAETYIDHTEVQPDEAFLDENIRKAAKSIMFRLPKKYQDVMILRIYAEMSFFQIGKALDISEISAKVIYFRAKKMLMEEMRNENYL